MMEGLLCIRIFKRIWSTNTLKEYIKICIRIDEQVCNMNYQVEVEGKDEKEVHHWTHIIADTIKECLCR